MEIKKNLKALDIKISKLATELGVSRPTLDAYIEYYESGQSIPNEGYQKIFEYLGVPLTSYKNSNLTLSNELLCFKNIFKYLIYSYIINTFARINICPIYLFFINTVFIALATFIIVRFLDYEKKTILDPRRERTVKHYMSLLAFITIAPSVLLGFRIVKQTIFEANADKFVASVIKFDKAQILKYDKTFSTSEPRIDVVLIGESVSEDAIANITAQLPQYGLKDVALNIRHANPQQEEMSMSLLQTNMEELLKDKNARIKQLEERLATYTRDAIPTSDISKEMSALIPKRVNTALSKTVVHNSAGEPTDTVLVCLIKTEPDVQLSNRDREQIAEWLKVRTKCSKIKLIVEE